MSKLNTVDIKAGNSPTPKTLQPGNSKCSINSIELEEFKYKPGSYYIMLHLEGPDLGPEFEGFFIDKDNETLGRHKGQVGKVKSSEWAYADGETKSGISIKRDDEILKFMKNLCTALDISNWLIAQNDKHDTIESLINAFNVEKPFANKVIEYCIAGKEYLNKAGYTTYELFLPNFSKAGAPFGTKKVITFNPMEHIKKKKVENVTDFGNDDTPNNTIFSLD